MSRSTFQALFLKFSGCNFLWSNAQKYRAGCLARQARSHRQRLPLAVASQCESVEPRVLLAANLASSNAYLLDLMGNRTDAPAAGSQVFVRQDVVTQDLPAGASYIVRQSIDGVPLEFSANWGTGVAGTTAPNSVYGTWFLPPGRHTAETQLDPTNLIAEGNEADNNRTFAFTAQSLSLVPTGVLGTTDTFAVPGLTGTYVNRNLRGYQQQDDWRKSQVVAGTRVDTNLDFSSESWGRRADVGLTNGSDGDWQDYSVQWDGFIRIDVAGTQLFTASDDGSRMWIDLNRDGTFESTGPEFVRNNWGNGQGLTTGPGSVSLAVGVYPIRIQYEEGGGGNRFQLLWNHAAIVPSNKLRSNTTLTTPGLTGTYFNQSLRGNAGATDWRQTPGLSVAGTRVDPQVSFNERDWGSRASVGLTKGSDANWEDFSTQWDGVIQVDVSGTRLFTWSDDGSRLWIDVNRDGRFANDATELVDNHFGRGQGGTTGPLSVPLVAGLYPVRMQYEEGGGGNQAHLLWDTTPSQPAQLRTGAVAAFSFENPLNAPVVNSIDGMQATLRGATLSTGFAGQGLLFANGADAVFADPRRFDVTAAHQSTVSFWFRSDTVQGQHVRMFSTGAANWTTGYWVGFGAGSRRVKFEMSDGRSVGVSLESQREVRGDGLWHLATAVMDGATARLYLDGQLQGTADIARLGEIRASNSVRLGKSYDDEAGSNFDGRIDEFTAHRRALSIDEIQRLYQQQGRLEVQRELRISDSVETEGTGGEKFATFTVSMSSASPVPVTVQYTTSNGSATAGSDFTSKSGTLTIAPGAGAASATISVPITTDSVNELTENFFVTLSNPTNATIADGQGEGRIQDDDPLPTVRIDDRSIQEGNNGTTTASFTVSLNAVSSLEVRGQYATANGTATAGTDYTATTGTFTIPAGSTTARIDVPIIGDTTVETDETFVVNLNSLVNATLADGQALGTIRNDDFSNEESDDPDTLLAQNLARIQSLQLSGGVSENVGLTNEPRSTTETDGLFAAGSIIADVLFGLDEGERQKTFSQNGSSKADLIVTNNRGNSIQGGAKNDVIYSRGGHDTVEGNTGSDQIFLGKGDDIGKPGAGDDVVDGGPGNDTLHASPGNDLLHGGEDNDTYRFEADWGRDRVVDSGNRESLKFELSASQLDYRRVGNDLEIFQIGGDSEFRNSAMIVDYFTSLDRGGWTITTNDSTASQSLEKVVGIDVERDIKAILLAYSVPPFGKPTVDGPVDWKLKATVSDPLTDLKAAILEPESPALAGHAIVSIAGTDFIDIRSVESLILAGVPQALRLLPDVALYVATHQLTELTLTGHSQGGLVAQEVGIAIAAAFPKLQVKVDAYDCPVIVSPKALANFTLTPIAHQWDIFSGLIRTPYSDLPIWRVVTSATPTSTFDLLKCHTLERLWADLGNNPLPKPTVRGEIRSVVQQVLERDGAKVSDALATVTNIITGLDPIVAALRNRVSGAVDSFYATVSASTRQFDMGTADSPLLPGATRVTSATRYSSSLGFGWLNNVESKDRGGTGDLARDFAFAPQLKFAVDLAPGAYDITLTLGNTADVHESILVNVNGYSQEVLTTLPNDVMTRTYRIFHSDPQLRITLNDLGGLNANAVLNGVKIQPVRADAPLVVNAPRPVNPSLIIETSGYRVPEVIDRIQQFLKVVWDVAHLVKDAASAVTGFQRGDVLNGFKSLYATLQDVQRIRRDLQIGQGSRVPEWVFQGASDLSVAARTQRLDTLNPALVPVSLNAIQSKLGTLNQKVKNHEPIDALLAEIAREWKGSRDFAALDWTERSNDGIGIFDFVEKDHRAAIKDAASAIVALIRVKLREVRLADPNNPNLKLDVLFLGHGFGATVNREVLRRLASTDADIAPFLDYSKVVSFDPIAVNPDEETDERAKSHDLFYYYHPERSTYFVDALTNYFQTNGIAPGDILEDRLVLNKPLDGKDGGSLLGAYNRQVRVWDVNLDAEVQRFRHWEANGSPADGEMWDVDYSPNGQWLAAAGSNGIITIRDAVSGTKQQTFRMTQGGPVYSLAFLPDSQGIVSLSSGGGLRIHRLGQTEPVWTEQHENGVTLAVSPDGKYIATGGELGNILVWERQGAGPSYSKISTLTQHTGRIASLAFSRDNTLVSGSTDNTVRVWKLVNSRYEKAQEPLRFDGNVHSVAFAEHSTSSTPTQLFVGAGQKLIRLQRNTSSNNWEPKAEIRDHVAPLRALDVNENGTRIVTAGDDNTIFVYDAATLGKLQVFDQPMLPVRELALAPNGLQFAVASNDDNGGPVSDRNVNGALSGRVSVFTKVFGLPEWHTEVPFVYFEEVVQEGRESFLWAKDNPSASRPGDLPLNQNFTINPVRENNAPVAAPITQQIRPNQRIEIDLRPYISDRDLDKLNGVSVTPGNPFHGTVKFKDNDPLTVVFTPEPNATRPAVFSYTVTDPWGVTATAQVAISVGNTAPTVNAISRELAPRGRLEIRLNEYGVDREGDSMTFVSATVRTHQSHVEVRPDPNQPNHLVIRSLDDFYSADPILIDVVIKDQHGALSDPGQLKVFLKQPAPTAPTGLSATPNSATKITLNWNDSANETDYRVFQNSGGGWQLIASPPKNATSYQVTGLIPKTNYQFKVAAFNSVATTDSEPKSAETEGVNFSAGTSTKTSVSLTWKPVEWATTPIVKVRLANSTSWTNASVTNQTGTGATVTGLLPKTDYVFKVRFEGSGGKVYETPDQPGVSVSTQGLRFDAVGSPTATSAKFDWEGFESVTYFRLVGSGPRGEIANEWATATQRTISGLIPNTLYKVRLEAANASLVKIYQTNSRDIFTPTINHTFSNVTKTKASIGWAAIEWATTTTIMISRAGGSFTPAVTENPTSTGGQIKLLLPNENYSVKVVFQGSNNRVFETTATSFKTDAVNFQRDGEPGRRQVSFSWDAIDDITQYVLVAIGKTAGRDGLTTLAPVRFTTSNTSFTATQLVPNVTYDFYLEAVIGGATFTSVVRTATTDGLRFTTPSNTNNSVALKWADFTQATQFIVYYRVLGTTKWMTFKTLAGTATGTTVTGLKSSTNYQFQLEVQLGIPQSGFSNILDQRT